MDKRHANNDGDAETIHELKRDRARLRIAYIKLYQQFLDLDEHCNNNHKYNHSTLGEDEP
jgi:hypothetical protein